MESRIVNSVSGNTIKEIQNPIRWLFNNYRAVVSFEVKALQDGGGLLIAQLDNDTRFRMAWADYSVMMDCLLKSRAWKNHFSGTSVYRADSNGNFTTTYTI